MSFLRFIGFFLIFSWTCLSSFAFADYEDWSWEADLKFFQSLRGHFPEEYSRIPRELEITLEQNPNSLKTLSNFLKPTMDRTETWLLVGSAGSEKEEFNGVFLFKEKIGLWHFINFDLGGNELKIEKALMITKTEQIEDFIRGNGKRGFVDFSLLEFFPESSVGFITLKNGGKIHRYAVVGPQIKIGAPIFRGPNETLSNAEVLTFFFRHLKRVTSLE